MMNESSSEWTSPAPMRERELELEIARLNAELEAAKGVDAGAATSRFLTLAASTVDAALEDARREADELAAEVTADAEARRDEATRLAAEAEARAEAMRAEAENHESVVIAAHETAGQIRSNAEVEAANLVASERAKVVDEIESLSQVRAALEGERESLESYHDELQRRVQELAESMVNFMTTEPPIAARALEELVGWETHVDVAEEPSVTIPGLEDPVAAAEEPVVHYAPFEELGEPTDDTFAGADVVSTSDTVFDVMDEVPPVPHVPTSGGLFSRATEEEAAVERSPLFGAHGFRLVQQTNADELSEALGYEDEADAAFESFLAGDSEADPSRDWLLRPEQS